MDEGNKIWSEIQMRTHTRCWNCSGRWLHLELGRVDLVTEGQWWATAERGIVERGSMWWWRTGGVDDRDRRVHWDGGTEPERLKHTNSLSAINQVTY